MHPFPRVMSRNKKGEINWNGKPKIFRAKAESDVRRRLGNCKMFVEIWPHWKAKGRLQVSSTISRMRVNSAVWLRIFVMR